jgi:PadR family transcriptional regulator, regulatory protein PadR
MPISHRSPAPRYDSQLLKGVLSLVLLRLLADRESYGYELVARVRARGLTDVAEGSVYPALARLERDGLLLPRIARHSGGPPRKYYRPSALGRHELAARTRAWTSLVTVVDPLLRGEPAPSTGVLG